MPPYDLLAIDLDGTLLNSQGEISPANRLALQSKQQGKNAILLGPGAARVCGEPD